MGFNYVRVNPQSTSVSKLDFAMSTAYSQKGLDLALAWENCTKNPTFLKKRIFVILSTIDNVKLLGLVTPL